MRYIKYASLALCVSGPLTVNALPRCRLTTSRAQSQSLSTTPSFTYLISPTVINDASSTDTALATEKTPSTDIASTPGTTPDTTPITTSTPATSLDTTPVTTPISTPIVTDTSPTPLDTSSFIASTTTTTSVVPTETSVDPASELAAARASVKAAADAMAEIVATIQKAIKDIQDYYLPMFTAPVEEADAAVNEAGQISLNLPAGDAAGRASQASEDAKAARGSVRGAQNAVLTGMLPSAQGALTGAQGAATYVTGQVQVVADTQSVEEAQRIATITQSVVMNLQTARDQALRAVEDTVKELEKARTAAQQAKDALARGQKAVEEVRNGG